MIIIIQIHNLLGYDPSDICNMNKKKKINQNSNIEIFNRNEDILIVGNNNKFYRGRVHSCEISPLKKPKEKQVKIKLNKDENNEINQIHFEQFDQTNKTMFDEHLFQYLDWQIQFNEQVFRRKEILFFFRFIYIRIYRMNFVKNYFSIGYQLFVMINHVVVIQNQNQI